MKPGELNSIQSSRKFGIHRFFHWILLVALGIWASLTIIRLFTNTFSPIFSIYPPLTDFRTFWYAGHFVRQETDPYQATFESLSPNLPIRYLDGKEISVSPVAQMQIGLPMLTAPLVLFMTLFSFFSWNVAKVLWMVFNLGFIGFIPFLVIRILPGRGRSLKRFQKWLVIFLFMGLSATRSVSSNAHVTLLVFTLILCTLLLEPKDWFLAGISFGFALSKFNLTLPLLLFLLFERKYKIIILAAIVQFSGILGLWIITGTSPLLIVQEYVQILQVVASSLAGIQLSSLLPPGSAWIIPVNLIFSLVIWAPNLMWILQNRPSFKSNKINAVKFHILVILFLWSTLISYHMSYDATIYILFISLLIFGLQNQIWDISKKEKIILIPLFILCIIFMELPGNITFLFLPDRINHLWLTFMDKAITITLLISTFISLWLLFRVKKDGLSA